MHLHADGASQLILSIAVAHGAPQVDERLSVVQAGNEVDVHVVEQTLGTRLHVADVGEGDVQVDYSATVHGSAPEARVSEADEILYLRPSRYCESDTLGPIALAEFHGLERSDLLTAVSSWVGTRLAYVPGSSLPTDGAVRTLLARRGVCRDYAHLVVALLRALDVPARVVSVYAPGLSPMDFHAVAEAAVDGAWRVVDPTTLAPRSTLLRIATGRDASDTAFLSVRGSRVTLQDLEVSAIVDELPVDDMDALVALR